MIIILSLFLIFAIAIIVYDTNAGCAKMIIKVTPIFFLRGVGLVLMMIFEIFSMCLTSPFSDDKEK